MQTLYLQKLSRYQIFLFQITSALFLAVDLIIISTLPQAIPLRRLVYHILKKVYSSLLILPLAPVPSNVKRFATSRPLPSLHRKKLAQNDSLSHRNTLDVWQKILTEVIFHNWLALRWILFPTYHHLSSGCIPTWGINALRMWALSLYPEHFQRVRT